MRPSKRNPDELRRVSIERAVSKHAEGSCLIKFGDTHVLCTASLEERVPPWLKGQGRGWVTVGHASGRTQEIQRLIGRALRAIVDLPKLGERQISVDCDVIQADGGTRTAAITGAWVALHDCIQWMKLRDMVKDDVLRDQIAAVSCGLYKGTAVLDLDYAEDSAAEADSNFVMTGSGGIVEVQGTAETVAFSQESFDQLMALAKKGIGELVALQKLTVS
jgi:ribonuclease PH